MKTRELPASSQVCDVFIFTKIISGFPKLRQEASYGWNLQEDSEYLQSAKFKKYNALKNLGIAVAMSSSSRADTDCGLAGGI